MSTAERLHHDVIAGYGLELRPWDEELVRQASRWGERGFPFHAFDLGRLRDPRAASAWLARTREDGPHRFFVACEDDTAVGRVSVNMKDEQGLYLWSVHVPPEHGGRGVARRMLATLMTWLEVECPGRPFVLTSNTFATTAHRVYGALGFAVTASSWQHDRDIADLLWRDQGRRGADVAGHVRFVNGRWEVRTLSFRREPGTPMDVLWRPD